MTQASGSNPAVANALRNVVGDEHVRAAVESDVVGGVQPDWVVEPATTVEVARLLQVCSERGLRVIARGSGSKLGWGNPPRALDLLLSTSRLNRVVEHAAGDMTATVQAGCTIADLQSHLARGGQRLALDPMWPNRATVGGVLATNDGGSLRAAFGSCRDLLIGITVALADGTVARSGGKVVKNVAGYDLPKLFIGSFGTLGVITEATFRLHPIPVAAQTLSFKLPAVDQLGLVLSACQECSLLLSAVQIELATDAPEPRLTLLAEATAAGALADKVARITAAMQAAGAKAEPDSRSNPFEARHCLYDDTYDGAVCKVTCLPIAWVELASAAVHIASSLDVGFRLVGQAVGVGTIAFRSSEAEPLVSAVQQMREKLESLSGTLVVQQGHDAVRSSIDAWGTPGDTLPLMRRIKHQFDPIGILSPGRYVGGI
jgi:glycolate oxidase FAD binding subunit